jgi:capsular exopolysaccharide synthesis family protein
LGKFSKALAKHASEKKEGVMASLDCPTLTAADIEVLIAYDENTGHLLKCDTETGLVDQARVEELRDRGTVMRLLQNDLIHPGGKLTPKGVEEARRLAKIAGAFPRRIEMTTSDEVEKANETHAVMKEAIQTEAELQRLEPPALFREAPAVAGEKPIGVFDVPAKSEVSQPLKIVSDFKPVQAQSKSASSAWPSLPQSPLAIKTEPLPAAGTTWADGSAVSASEWNDAAIDPRLVALHDPQSFEAEQFKILRTNILFPLAGKPPRSILLTSAAPGEGKTFAAANLAISIALNINRYVLLIDADLRWPQIHTRFGFPPVPGLSNYLAENRPLSSLLLHTKVSKLTLLPAGPSPDNPSELISSERMANLLNEVSTRYPDRLIVIDAPPPAMAAETGVLARAVDGVIVVVRYGSTRREALTDLIARIGDKKILGSIVNRVETADTRYYGYKYAGYGKSKRK